MMNDGSEAFHDVVEALRRLQDALSCSRPPRPLLAALAEQLALHADEAEESRCAPGEEYWGRAARTPGRDQLLVPPYRVLEWSNHHLRAELFFGAAHAGARHRAHGGAIALVLDDAMGRLANKGREGRALTAELQIRYLRPVPTAEPLQLTATVDSESDTVRLVSAEISEGGAGRVAAAGRWVVPNSSISAAPS